jgi:hypothetical protein
VEPSTQVNSLGSTHVNFPPRPCIVEVHKALVNMYQTNAIENNITSAFVLALAFTHPWKKRVLLEFRSEVGSTNMVRMLQLIILAIDENKSVTTVFFLRHCL